MPTDDEPWRADTSPSRSRGSGDHRAGDLVGRRWRLERFLDGGGMGAVWEAVDQRLDEPAAIKVLNPIWGRTGEARARFLREARAAARIRGPNVVSVLDFDIDEQTGAPYMAMELLRGESLASRLRRGPLGALQTRALLRDIGRAVGRAHRLGVIHRDLKPGNIYLTETDEGLVAKILDFGIAKVIYEGSGAAPITETGRALGTPHYMAPEQIADAKEVDHRADIWAVGVIAYQCLTGQLPFPGSVPVQVVHKICFERPVPASKLSPVPEGFDAWLDRSTRPKPEERFESVQEQVDAFLALSQAEGRVLDEPIAAPLRPRPRPRAWVSDANQVDIETIDEVVFRTPLIEQLMADDRRCFISGAKGCGKTLLLTYKRAHLSARYQSSEKKDARAVTFIPEGRPYLDLMSDVRTLGRSTLELMADLGSAKRLWGFALRLSALSHAAPGARPELSRALPVRLAAIAEGQKTEPTVVAKELLALTPTQIHQLLNDTELLLEHGIRELHSGVFFFIDKIDQALRGTSKEAWISMQAGLVEAAWDLMGTNAHVKVFATIREEAFSAYESDIKTNLFGATTRLRYSKTELRQMLERLTTYYEGVPLSDFVVVDVVSAGAPHQVESAFDHIYRHTLGRPRDLVIVASELSRRRDELDERTFKAIVKETCAHILVANVFDEMRVFLEVLADRKSRARFLSCLPFDALTRDDLIEIWSRFHGVGREYFDDWAVDSGDAFHPFRELYDCGLLGVIGVDEEGHRAQRFKEPHQPMGLVPFELPSSELYLLHPSLPPLMRQMGIEDGFRHVRDVVLGQGRGWEPHHRLLVRIQRELFRAPARDDASVARAVEELVTALGQTVTSGEPLISARRRLADSETFERVCKRLEELGWDDLHLALLEAFDMADPTRLDL